MNFILPAVTQQILFLDDTDFRIIIIIIIIII